MAAAPHIEEILKKLEDIVSDPLTTDKLREKIRTVVETKLKEYEEYQKKMGMGAEATSSHRAP
jgi:CCR4-NOT transcriptional regulation complex NOT5 subunit